MKCCTSCCTEVSNLLPVAFSEAGDDKLLVHIDTTTFVVNFLHTGTSLDDNFTARYSVSYHFTLRPSAVNGWTDGGANEST